MVFVLGALEDSNLRVRPIADCRRVLAPRPSYLARRRMPRTGQDLIDQRHDCLLHRYPGAREFVWTLVTPDGPQRFEVTGTLESDDGDVLTGWALAGRGIILKPVFEIADHLASGALVPVAEDTPPQDIQLACLYPHKRLQDPKSRLFIDYMVAACKKAARRHPRPPDRAGPVSEARWSLACADPSPDQGGRGPRRPSPPAGASRPPAGPARTGVSRARGPPACARSNAAHRQRRPRDHRPPHAAARNTPTTARILAATPPGGAARCPTPST